MHVPTCTLSLQKGAIESAIEDYQMMVDIDPSDSSAILKMGMHHFNKKYAHVQYAHHVQLQQDICE